MNRVGATELSDRSTGRTAPSATCSYLCGTARLPQPGAFQRDGLAKAGIVL